MPQKRIGVLLGISVLAAFVMGSLIPWPKQLYETAFWAGFVALVLPLGWQVGGLSHSQRVGAWSLTTWLFFWCYMACPVFSGLVAKAIGMAPLPLIGAIIAGGAPPLLFGPLLIGVLGAEAGRASFAVVILSAIYPIVLPISIAILPLLVDSSIGIRVDVMLPSVLILSGAVIVGCLARRLLRTGRQGQQQSGGVRPFRAWAHRTFTWINENPHYGLALLTFGFCARGIIRQMATMHAVQTLLLNSVLVIVLPLLVAFLLWLRGSRLTPMVTGILMFSRNVALATGAIQAASLEAAAPGFVGYVINVGFIIAIGFLSPWMSRRSVSVTRSVISEPEVGKGGSMGQGR